MSEWIPTTIGEITKRLLNGGTPSTGVQSLWTGSIPWITGADFAEFGIGEFRRFISDTAVQQTATNVVRKGELLIVTRTGVGKLAIAPCDIAISQDITGLYPDRDRVDARFLFHRMKLGVEDLKKLNQGTSINGIVREDLLTYRFDLPPMREQRFIADVLSTLDESIQETEALIAKKQHVMAGLMHVLFTRGILPNGELRPPREEAPQLYKQSALGWIPKEWDSHSCGDVLPISVGYVGPVEKYFVDSNEGIPLLSTTNIGNDGFVGPIGHYVSKQFHQRNRKSHISPGDILIARHGKSGQSAIVPNSVLEAQCLNVVVIRKGKSLLYRYVAHLFMSDSTRNRLMRHSVGSVQGVVNTRSISRFQIPVPPYAEQERVDSLLSAIESRRQGENDFATKLSLVRNALMHDLLTGRVRIPESMLKRAAAAT